MNVINKKKSERFILGLTGGIGCGKSTIANMFAKKGIDIIDADVVAREVVQPDSEALSLISSHFGNNILTNTGELDRTALRTLIFENEDDKIWLNNLLHPLIRESIFKQLAETTSPYAILVAPLLFENNLAEKVDHVLVIDVSESCQVTRTNKRDSSSEQEIKRIINSQISRSKRIELADDIINNEINDLSQVECLVEQLHRKFVKLADKCN